MQKEVTIWQRFMSDTPLFFRKAQLFGIGLAGLGTSLSQVSSIPAKLTTILISAGTTIAIVAQFAVKQAEPLTIATNDDVK